ncbi:hypothetical protein [Aporhodopirellula aestuarii]|uniref:Uncharacterized protein n=1 Tax=Aporhodopirellula aestuarii TaxID=2950107 RepID=A0ABT0U756_9BACT|nr:hypothetical protein [Aporhodopirellula aestuarii]MCM2372738.1 hypothetical protein [Aporhodopirellula aestuarii]
MKESFVGDREVLAKIHGYNFELMPIGIWPLKGRTSGPSAGALIGTIQTEGTGSRIDLSYRIPVIVTAFLSVTFLFTCLLSLLTATTLDLTPNEDDRSTLIGMIFGFPICVILIAIAMIAPAWQQSEMMRHFFREIIEEDPQIFTKAEAPIDAG